MRERGCADVEPTRSFESLVLVLVASWLAGWTDLFFFCSLSPSFFLSLLLPLSLCLCLWTLMGVCDVHIFFNGQHILSRSRVREKRGDGRRCVPSSLYPGQPCVPDISVLRPNRHAARRFLQELCSISAEVARLWNISFVIVKAEG